MIFRSPSAAKAAENHKPTVRVKDGVQCPLCGGWAIAAGFTSLDCSGDPKCPNYKGSYGGTEGNLMWAYHQHEYGYKVQRAYVDWTTGEDVWIDAEPDLIMNALGTRWRLANTTP